MARDFLFIFFSAKSGTPLSFRSPFFFLGKKAAGQILTGLVVLVVDMDSARFHINVLLRVSGVDRGGYDVSLTLLLLPSLRPL